MRHLMVTSLFALAVGCGDKDSDDTSAGGGDDTAVGGGEGGGEEGGGEEGGGEEGGGEEGGGEEGGGTGGGGGDCAGLPDIATAAIDWGSPVGEITLSSQFPVCTDPADGGFTCGFRTADTEWSLAFNAFQDADEDFLPDPITGPAVIEVDQVTAFGAVNIRKDEDPAFQAEAVAPYTLVIESIDGGVVTGCFTGLDDPDWLARIGDGSGLTPPSGFTFAATY